MKRMMVAALIGAPLAFASPAMAQSPAADGYGGQGVLGSSATGVASAPATGQAQAGSGVLGSSAQGTAPAGSSGTAPASTTGTGTRTLVALSTSTPVAATGTEATSTGLPFTGLDVRLLVAGGLGLLLLGVAFRRLARLQSPRI